MYVNNFDDEKGSMMTRTTTYIELDNIIRPNDKYRKQILITIGN